MRCPSPFVPIALAVAVSTALASNAMADPAPRLPAPGEAWRNSPFHAVQDAATGKPIPCRCLYRERSYRVGEAVCMTTHRGTVIARCDLSLNNTTWAATDEACTVSMLIQ